MAKTCYSNLKPYKAIYSCRKCCRTFCASGCYNSAHDQTEWYYPTTTRRTRSHRCGIAGTYRCIQPPWRGPYGQAEIVDGCATTYCGGTASAVGKMEGCQSWQGQTLGTSKTEPIASRRMEFWALKRPCSGVPQGQAGRAGDLVAFRPYRPINLYVSVWSTHLQESLKPLALCLGESMAITL